MLAPSLPHQQPVQCVSPLASPHPPLAPAALASHPGEVAGMTLSLNTTPADFSTAQASCNAQGGHLAYFASLEVRH